MPKMKTHKGAQSRFHVTGSGKIMRRKGGNSHLRLAKSKRVKRTYDEMIPLNSGYKTSIKRLLPYGVK